MSYVEFNDISNEAIGRVDFEALANQPNYNVVSGFAAAFSNSTLEVVVDAGVAMIGGALESATGDTLLLTPDSVHPRWAIIWSDDTTVGITHAVASPTPFKPNLTVGQVPLYAVRMQQGLLVAEDAELILDKRGGTAENVVLKAYAETVNTVAATGTTETIDASAATVHDITLDDDCALTFAGTATGRSVSFTLIVRQDGSGGHAVTWPSVLWAGGTEPVVTTTASAVDVFTFFAIGTTWYGFTAGQAMATP